MASWTFRGKAGFQLSNEQRHEDNKHHHKFGAFFAQTNQSQSIKINPQTEATKLSP